MSDTKLIAGTAYVYVDGKQYMLAGSMNTNIQKNIREGKAGLSGPVGYIETPNISYIEGSFYNTAGLTVEQIERITNATVTAELPNHTYLLEEAWTAKEHTIDAATGEVPIRFEGMRGKETTKNA